MKRTKRQGSWTINRTNDKIGRRSVAAGAFLFWISDLMLAVNRFRRPFEYHRLNLAFYYGGRLLIALSPAYFG